MGGWLPFLSFFTRLISFLQLRLYAVLPLAFRPLPQPVVYDRRKIRKEKSIPTVSKARKLEKRRSKLAQRRAKRQNCIDELFLRLKMLGSPLLIEYRRIIAYNVPKFAKKGFIKLRNTRAFKQSQNKALLLIFQEIHRLIPLEKDPAVAISLMKLEQKLEWCHPLTRFPCWSDSAILCVGADLLEQKPDIKVRFAAFTMILDQVWRVLRIDEHVAGRIARVCAQLLEDWRANGGQMSAERHDYTPWYTRAGLWEDAELHITMELNAQDVTDLLGNDDVMTAIFDVLRTELRVVERRMSWENHAANCLSILLRKSSDADRAFLKRRYYDDLKMAFTKMSEGNFNCIQHVDLAAIIATDTSLLNIIWRRMMDGGFYSFGCWSLYDDEATLAVHLLEYGLQTDDSELQRMLGLGLLLPAARYFASLESTRDDKAARTFSSILEAHPEYRQEFRKATENGKGISHTYQLGRTIPQRISKPAEYILEDYVDFN